MTLPSPKEMADAHPIRTAIIRRRIEEIICGTAPSSEERRDKYRCGTCASYKVSEGECWSADSTGSDSVTEPTRLPLRYQLCEAWVPGLRSLSEPLAFLFSSKRYKRISALHRLWERGLVDDAFVVTAVAPIIPKKLDASTIVSEWSRDAIGFGNRQKATAIRALAKKEG